MSLSKLEAKNKRTSRKFTTLETDRLRRAEELLKEVDSLALLLEEVKRQSQRIQAAADAIGEEVFGDDRLGKASETIADKLSPREGSIGPKLVVRSRSAENNSVNNRSIAVP